MTLGKSSSSSGLTVPEDGFLEPVTSPSNIAAKLAAARYSPMRPTPSRTSTPAMTERETSERDVLPPPGSVGNVLARLDSRQQNVHTVRRDEVNTDPIAIARAKHAGLDKPTDDSPIPPTSSLVTMFEQHRPVSHSPTPVRSPKPQRNFRLPPEPKDGEPLARQRTKTPPPVKPKPKPLSDAPHSTDGAVENASFKNLRKDTFNSSPPVRKTSETVAVNSKNVRPKPQPKRISSSTRPKSEDMTRPVSRHSRRLSSSHGPPSSPSSFVSARETQEEKPKPKPTIPPPRRSGRPAQEVKQTQRRPSTPTGLTLPSPTRARASSKPTSPLPPSTRITPPRRSSVSGTSTPSGTLYHSNYQRESARSITKHMTGESLSSAIMGAALASSRNASPARPSSMHLSQSPALTPPLPARRHHHFNHSPFGRSPSPTKLKPQSSGKLRTTMRREPSSSSDEEESERYKRKGTRIMGMGRKHPNKHHEGTRKRWRDQITERERKRYEGVWAANKGLFISSPSPAGSRDSSRARQHYSEDDPSQDVLNLVAKEIWSRSRLPEHVLEEVWDLVDSRAIGRLKREEFVVGLWLIDQRLKGRKLPIKVSDSVWQSVRGAAGVKVHVGDRHSHKVHKPHVKNPVREIL